VGKAGAPVCGERYHGVIVVAYPGYEAAAKQFVYKLLAEKIGDPVVIHRANLQENFLADRHLQFVQYKKNKQLVVGGFVVNH
jgi:hypothetical protein